MPAGLSHLATDGSCLVNPGGPGGWAFILFRNDKELKRLSGSEERTTNNRMEIQAVIEGLRCARRYYPGESVKVLSDSQYVVKGITLWMHGWSRKDFTGIANPDLWNTLYGMCAVMEVTAEFVRGHNGHRWNEECDRMAYDALKQEAH